MREPVSLPVTTMSPEAAKTLRESLGGGPGLPGRQRGMPMWQGHVWEAGVCGVFLAPARGPFVRSAWLGAGGYRRHHLPRGQEAGLYPPGPGCLTEPLHRPGKQPLGRQPPTPSRLRGGGGPPVTEHALGLSRRDPSPRPSPSLGRPLLLTNAGFVGREAWGRKALTAEGLQCRGQPSLQTPPRAPRAPLQKWVLC